MVFSSEKGNFVPLSLIFCALITISTVFLRRDQLSRNSQQFWLISESIKLMKLSTTEVEVTEFFSPFFICSWKLRQNNCLYFQISWNFNLFEGWSYSAAAPDTTCLSLLLSVLHLNMTLGISNKIFETPC